MFAQVYYLIRSRTDGQYLAARPHATEPSSRGQKPAEGYLLLFNEHFDALSYLNTHAKDVSDRFSVESLSGSQLSNLIKRWGFVGVGIVQDPLLPRVEFLSHG